MFFPFHVGAAGGGGGGGGGKTFFVFGTLFFTMSLGEEKVGSKE